LIRVGWGKMSNEVKNWWNDLQGFEQDIEEQNDA
jgi:hypothetical protein